MLGRVLKTSIGGSLNNSSWFKVVVDVETYLVKVNIVAIKMTSVGTNANKLKVKASRDENGDDQIITDTESRIFDGVTTSTTGGASYRFDGIMPANDENQIFLWFQLNDDTATLDQVLLTYETE